MRKSILKRVKITRNGKMIHRKPGMNHFNAKQSRRQQQRQKATVEFTTAFQRNITQMLGQ